MRKWSKVTAVLLMAVFLGAMGRTATAGPDPPPGKFSFGISLNDGTDPNVPEYVPFGEPCFYPGWGGGTFSAYAHGWFSVPQPPAGGQSYVMIYTQGSKYNGVADQTQAEVTRTFEWNAAGTYHWTMFCYGARTVPGVGYTADLYSPCTYEQRFVMEVKTPNTGGSWVKVGEGTQSLGF